MLGTTLHSHYKILKVLSIGKSGTTYLAKDLDALDSPAVVVKRVECGDSDLILPPLAEKIFETQGSIAYQVGQHPQIPSLIAKFVENGNSYLVYEYIDGEILDRELASGCSWSQTQVFDFLMDLIGILSFVHSFKYIHQDINPHHIIRRKEDGRFSSIGFNSIKDLGSSWQNLPNYDPRNLNSSIYIPYEQEQNAPQFNSDLYAVGAIAIQAMAGKVPVERDPDSYEFKWPEGINIDRKLIKIIDKMVRPDYRNRYQSAVEVLQDLQSFALTQIPAYKSTFSKPYALLGTAVCTLLLGFGTVKLLSASANKPQLPPIATATSTLATAPTTTDRQNWKSYVDKTAGIQLDYAANWQQQDIHNIVTGEQVMFISPQQDSIDKYRENISIRVENLRETQTTLSSYTQSAIAEIKKYYQDANIIESSAIGLAKRPGILVVYTGKDENSLPIKNLEAWTIDRGKAYIVTYKAEPDRYYQFLATAMATINSLELNY
jgi:eukaryotic-like serine/threonine-protein kinase